MRWLVLLLVLSGELFASGGAAATPHHASIKDLLYPMINATLFFGFLIYKLKKPTSEMFNKNYDEIKSQVEFSEKKNNEADHALKNIQNKLNNIPEEEKRIKADFESDFEKYKELAQQDLEAGITRTKKEFDGKFESEKEAGIFSLQSELLTAIVADTKKIIAGSNELKVKATKKILADI